MYICCYGRISSCPRNEGGSRGVGFLILFFDRQLKWIELLNRPFKYTVCSFAPRTTLSLPLMRHVTIPSFQAFRFLLLSAIITADPFLGHDACFPPAFTCRLHRPRTYSLDHRLHIARLHPFSIFVRFQRSFSPRCLGSNSGSWLGLMFNILAGVKTGSSTSS
jgi:hypothetical protein